MLDRDNNTIKQGQIEKKLINSESCIKFKMIKTVKYKLLLLQITKFKMNL